MGHGQGGGQLDDAWQSRCRIPFEFLAPILVVGVVWQLAVGLGLADSSVVSSPFRILRTFWRLTVSEPLLMAYVSASLYRLLAGYVSGCLTGIVLGFLMGCSRHFSRAIRPIVGFLIAIPTICWVPVLLITVGMGNTTVIVAVFLGCVFPVAYATLNGVRGVGQELIWASAALGARRSRTLLRVLLPGSLPSIVTGLRLAVRFSWRALVGAEVRRCSLRGRLHDIRGTGVL